VRFHPERGNEDCTFPSRKSQILTGSISTANEQIKTTMTDSQQTAKKNRKQSDIDTIQFSVAYSVRRG
jgi:hypothetical protein